MLVKWDPSQFRHIRDKEKLIKEGLWDKVRLDVWAGSTFTGHPGSVQHLNIPVAGDYKVRIKLSGLKPPGGRAPHMTVYAANLDRMLHEQDVLAPENQPITVEFLNHFTAGTHVIRTTNEVPAPSNLGRAGRSGAKPFFSIKDGRFPWQRKLTDEEGNPIEPFLLVDWVEWEGPVLASYPTRVQQQYSLSNDDPSQLRDVINRFAEAALRRPVKTQEIDRVCTLMQAEIAKGEKPTAALRTGTLAVLCMKDFFYVVEGSQDENHRRINDWELASRLSYFLWSTMPDEELRAAAHCICQGLFYEETQGNKKVFSQAFRLEDDFSQMTAAQRLWRIDAVDLGKRTLTVTGIQKPNDEADSKSTTFQIVPATRIWKGREFGQLKDVAVGQLVLINLTVCTLKGPGRCTDIWLDPESRDVATATQLEQHRLYQREHGLACQVEHVDNKQKIVTVTLFAGFDPSLRSGFKQKDYIAAAVANLDLRTHDQINDTARGPILEVIEGPATPGQSGVKLRFQPDILLEGYRPQRILRLFGAGWHIDDLPREERAYDG